MRFTKMQGIGNDYVYVDCISRPPPRDPVTLSRLISDRHFGVGSDGLILICPSERADVRMRMFNADGSEAEMCGNGVRCVAKYAYDHGLARKPRITVETGRGILALDCEVTDGKVQRVRVDMGEPILDAEQIPTTLSSPRVIDQPLPLASDNPLHVLARRSKLQAADLHVTCVSMGNPHAIFFCDSVAPVLLSEIGPIVEQMAVFPKRINVHFVQVHSPGEVTMRTWERGSGITLACGTGACAACVAGVLTGRTQRRVIAHLLGGDLELEWSDADGHVYKTGPAVEVFSGDWPD